MRGYKANRSRATTSGKPKRTSGKRRSFTTAPEGGSPRRRRAEEVADALERMAGNPDADAVLADLGRCADPG